MSWLCILTVEDEVEREGGEIFEMRRLDIFEISWQKDRRGGIGLKDFSGREDDFLVISRLNLGTCVHAETGNERGIIPVIKERRKYFFLHLIT